jgi:hypothetical protein
MAADAGAGLKGVRDRAFAFRRLELVALDVSNIEETPDGVKVTIRRSKIRLPCPPRRPWR